MDTPHLIATLLGALATLTGIVTVTRIVILERHKPK
jgi:hypothetical protein